MQFIVMNVRRLIQLGSLGFVPRSDVIKIQNGDNFLCLSPRTPFPPFNVDIVAQFHARTLYSTLTGGGGKRIMK